MVSTPEADEAARLVMITLPVWQWKTIGAMAGAFAVALTTELVPKARTGPRLRKGHIVAIDAALSAFGAAMLDAEIDPDTQAFDPQGGR